jgi:hypothetical protein
MLWALRAQVGVVYVFAALAKVGPDWLLHAQPLGIWLRARDEMPVLGPLFALPWTPLAMSWAGFLYDASIVPLLSWRRTRAFAFALVVVFHVLTRVLFEIGMFPGIMIVSTTLFFAPSWPRRFLRKAAVPAEGSRAHAPRVTGRAIAVACALVVVALAQVAIPLRHLAYGGSVLWDEQGMRFSWRVMVREKSGSVTYHVTSPARRKTWQVSPHDYLTWRQANEMSGQPDLMLQLAHHIAADFRRRGIDDVEVRAEARVSLNGRAPALLIDPTVDLARVEDSLARASWILPLHDDAPLAAVAIRGAR